jgi:ribosomal protein S12 methylthiotransferase
MHERLRECAEVQDPITQASRDALIGACVDVLVEGVDDETGEPFGRSHREAPEIDGIIRVRGAFARPGAQVRARVTSALGPDLVAEPV